jgi:hypothetical protein
VKRRGSWRAANDGVAHLQVGRLPQAACGVPAVGGQFAWPAQRRCLACLATEATSSLPEELLLAGYGVRPIER